MNPWGGIPAPQNKQDVNSILFSDVKLPDGVSVEWIKLYDSSVGISVFFNEYHGDPITLPSFKVLDVGFRRHAGKTRPASRSSFAMTTCTSSFSGFAWTWRIR